MRQNAKQVTHWWGKSLVLHETKCLIQTWTWKCTTVKTQEVTIAFYLQGIECIGFSIAIFVYIEKKILQ